MGYNETKLSEKLNKITEESIAENNSCMLHECLYKSEILNYKGNVVGTKTPYSEYIIKYLKDKEIIGQEIVGVNTKTRKALDPRNGEKLYFTPSHEKLLETINETSPRQEEVLVKMICRDHLYEDVIGKAIDYQVPLKSSSKGDCYGKIDLLTLKDNSLHLVEVKGKKSEETLLRACLELQTYYQLVDENKLKEDFIKAEKLPDNDFTIKKALLIFQGTQPAIEYTEAQTGTRPELNQLLNDFDIEVWVLPNV